MGEHIGVYCRDYVVGAAMEPSEGSSRAPPTKEYRQPDDPTVVRMPLDLVDMHVLSLRYQAGPFWHGFLKEPMDTRI